MRELFYNGTAYEFTNIKRFKAMNYLNRNIVHACINFAYKMSFGQGHHRDHRTGGQANRKNGEIFANALQGKLAEFAVYNELNNLNRGIVLNIPDLEVWGEGVWDTCDLIANGRHISIKSTKYYSQLLLLEKRDWDLNGCYIPNNQGNNQYDYFLLVRFENEIESIMKKNYALYSSTISNEKINKVANEIMNLNWSYDIPGFITNTEFIEGVIRARQIIPQGATLGQRTRMDAENYYVQTGDLHTLNEIIL